MNSRMHWLRHKPGAKNIRLQTKFQTVRSQTNTTTLISMDMTLLTQLETKALVVPATQFLSPRSSSLA